MRGPPANRSAALSPLKSEFNAFLFASIGIEQNDMALTVLSALARLGIDPWQEAARLAELAPDAATQRLTSIISGLPNGQWAPSDAGTIASRLLKLLPAKGVVGAPAAAVLSQLSPARSRIAMLLFAAALGGLMFSAMAGHIRPMTGTDQPRSNVGASSEAPLLDTH